MLSGLATFRSGYEYRYEIENKSLDVDYHISRKRMAFNAHNDVTITVNVKFIKLILNCFNTKHCSLVMFGAYTCMFTKIKG